MLRGGVGEFSRLRWEKQLRRKVKTGVSSGRILEKDPLAELCVCVLLNLLVFKSSWFSWPSLALDDCFLDGIFPPLCFQRELCSRPPAECMIPNSDYHQQQQEARAVLIRFLPKREHMKWEREKTSFWKLKRYSLESNGNQFTQRLSISMHTDWNEKGKKRVPMAKTSVTIWIRQRENPHEDRKLRCHNCVFFSAFCTTDNYTKLRKRGLKHQQKANVIVLWEAQSLAPLPLCSAHI